MLRKRTCVCGRSFSSEGEQSLHQRHCDMHKRSEVTAKLVEPLRIDINRLREDVQSMYVSLAHAFGAHAIDDQRETHYKTELANATLQNSTVALEDLVRRLAEAAKNPYAIVNRVKTEVDALVWALKDINTIIKNVHAMMKREK